MDKLKTSLAQLQLRVATVSDRHSAARAALAEATAARDRYALDGDLADEHATEKLQRAVDSARSTLEGWATALNKLQAEIADVEQKLAVDKAAAARKAASEALARDLDEFEKELPSYLEGARRIAGVLDAIHWHFESTEMGRFVANTASQVEVAAAFTLQELRGMVNTILEGSAPIPTPKPAPAPIAVVEPAPETQRVFMMKSAKYLDHAGRLRHAAQYEDADLPVAVAQRALRYGLAARTDDPRRRELLGAKGGVHVNVGAPDVADLTSEEAARPPHIDPVLREANFTPVDRGASRTLQISVARV